LDISTVMEAAIMVLLGGTVFVTAYQVATGSAVLGLSQMNVVVAGRVENAAILASGPGRLSMEVRAPQHEFQFSDGEARVKTGADALQGPGSGNGKRVEIPEGQYSAATTQDIPMAPLCLDENPETRFSRDCT